MVKTKEMKLECIFCGSSNFQIPHKDYVPKENENIKCGNCGKLNIYDDLLKIVKEKAVNEFKGDIEKYIKDKFKKFKK
ncbi:hypothetical protein Q6A87_07450 [Aliarcobacter skirrowii]|uniref:ECs_2282 family putative zinc-binding protein n=1 Tax=Aliarcobacter skirrowii TaxID=28200 RepID=UPI0029B75EA6|nr:hypothetical protein [Aliarcobacter skirrowii]MDX4067686.1 hypothetical protein [Aliarcobacter skirrowii]